MEQNNKNIEDEIDFGSVLKNPKRWFGLIYPFFIVVIIFIGAYYINNMDTIAKNKIPPSIIDSTKLFKENVIKKGTVITGIDLNILKNPSPEMIKKGGELFKTTCATCHGEKGMGDGVAGAALNPKPRNFTATDGWKNGRKLGDMFKTLREGIPNSGMVAYEFLPLEDRFAIIFYLRTLSNNFPAIAETEIADLNNLYKLTESRTEPAQITTDMAIKSLLAENNQLNEKAKSMLNYIESQKYGNGELGIPSNGYYIFEKVINNREKLVYSLQHSSEWKESIDKFTVFAIQDIPYNGFKPTITELSKEELAELQNYLKRVIGL